MKVYIVVREDGGSNSSTIVIVFADQGKAEKWIEEHNHEHGNELALEMNFGASTSDHVEYGFEVDGAPRWRMVDAGDGRMTVPIYERVD